MQTSTTVTKVGHHNVSRCIMYIAACCLSVKFSSERIRIYSFCNSLVFDFETAGKLPGWFTMVVLPEYVSSYDEYELKTR